MQQCGRCGGADGAHYAGCLLQRLLEVLGADYPLIGPSSPASMATASPAAIEPATVNVEDVTPDAPASAPAPLPAPEPTPQEPPADAVGAPVPPAVPAQKPALTEQAAAIDMFLEEHLRPGDRVTAAQVAAAYDDWRPHLDAPPARAMQIGMRMRARGIKSRQVHSRFEADRLGVPAKATVYEGVCLVGPAPEEPPPPPKPVPVEEPRPEVREPRVVTVLHGDDAYLADTDRPGPELPKDYRELVAKALEKPGWRYRRSNPRGTGKPRLYPPMGRPFTLPNTPSDHRGLANTRAALRRLGAAV